MARGRSRRGRAVQEVPSAEVWLAEVARDASQVAGGAPVELLGDYLSLLAEAATTGRKPQRYELDAVGLLGRRAAELGVPAGHAVQLYLSAAWRLWRELPTVVQFKDLNTVRIAAEAVLRVVDHAVGSLAEGYTAARREMMRREETLRRELIEDLLRGDADVGGLVERAEPFGLDMEQPHRVALAAPTGQLAEAEAAVGALERAAVQWLGDRDVLVATKDGRIVVVAPAEIAQPATAGSAPAAKILGDLMHTELSRSGRADHGGSPSAGPTPAPTASPAPTRRPATDSQWRPGWAWTPRSSSPRIC